MYTGYMKKKTLAEKVTSVPQNIRDWWDGLDYNTQVTLPVICDEVAMVAGAVTAWVGGVMHDSTALGVAGLTIAGVGFADLVTRSVASGVGGRPVGLVGLAKKGIDNFRERN